MKRLGSCTSRHHTNKYGVVNNDEVDRISELPEPILHQILSFLRTRDATKTSTLSKTWYFTFNSFPVLDFDQYDYLYGDYSNRILSQSFYNYVNSSITRRCSNVSVRRFRVAVLFCYRTMYVEKDLEKWLNYVVDNNVKDLTLCYPKDGMHILHMSVLFHANKSSMKELDLRGFKILVEADILDRLNIASGCYFSSLKKLKLNYVHIDEQILQRLLSNTCSLEEVSIDNCHGFRSVSLCSANLKSVELYLYELQVKKITIEAPNLRYLGLGPGGVDVLSSILEASSKCYAKNLKELELRGVLIDDAIFRLIQGFGGVLEKLGLIECQGVETIRISSCQLISNSVVKCNHVELAADCLECWKAYAR